MYQFCCKPDFEKLNSTYDIKFDADFYSGFDDFNFQEGYFESLDFDQTGGMEFESNFKNLIEEFNIAEHYNELMFLIQSNYKDAIDLYFHHASLYNENLRSKEMAKLISFLNNEKNKNSLQLNLSSSTDKVKITDPKLTTWLFNLLNKEIDNWFKNQPFYGDLFQQSFFQSTQIMGLNRDEERLKKIATLKNPHYTKQLTKIKAELCLFLHPYLQEYSLLKAIESTYSDNQYRFWFKLLELLKLQKEIESDPTDYMASLISNYKKSND